MLELVSSNAELETVELFSIDGMAFEVPAHPRAGISLGYIKEVRKSGELAAGAWLLEELLGEAAYDALVSWPELTNEILETIITAAVALIAGEVEDPKDARKSKKAK